MFQYATSEAILPVDRARTPDPSERGGAMLAWGEMPSFLLRRGSWIVGGVLATIFAVLLAIVIVPPSYTSSTEVLVQPTDLKAVDGAVNQVPNQPDTSVALLETAARVLVSRKVLVPVVAKLDLAADPEFAHHASPLRALVAGLRHALDIDPDVPDPGPAQNAYDALAKRIAVRRSERTFVISLSVRSKDPAKAARIANAIVASFFDVEATARADAAHRVSDAISSRLADLRNDVRRDEDAVQAFRVANNLAVANGQIVNEQQLSEASAQLLAAENATADAKAKLEQVQSALRGQDPGAIPESLSSQTVGVLRSQLAQVSRQEAYAATVYGERYPQLAQIKSEVAAARRAVNNEIQRIRETARNEYARAQASEANLRVNLARQQAVSTKTNAARIRLRELERDADASRGIYEAFLRRARETAEQEQVDTLNAWVISPAVAPAQRSFPPSNLILLVAALAGGLGIGLGSAFLRERTDPRLWTRSRVEAVTGMPVLATVDAPRGATSLSALGWEAAGRGGIPPEWPASADAMAGLVQLLTANDGPAAHRIVLLLGSHWDDTWLAAQWLAAAATGEVQRTTLVRFGARSSASAPRSDKGSLTVDDASFKFLELLEPTEPWEVPVLIDRLRGCASEFGSLVIVAGRQGTLALPQLTRLADATLLILARARSTRAEARSLAQRLRSKADALRGAVLIHRSA